MRVDVSEQTNLATSTQDEAVRNIEGSQLFTLDPVTFKENWEQLQPEIDRMAKPKTATPVVAEEMSRSPEHAAAISPDGFTFGELEMVSKQFSDFLDPYVGSVGAAISNRAGPARELNDLTTQRRMNGGKFNNENEELRYESLLRSSETNFGTPDLGSTGRNLPANVAGVATDMVTSVSENKTLFGALAGSALVSSTVTGAVAGAAAGGVGAIPGAAAGFLVGLGPAIGGSAAATMFYDTFNRTSNDVYNGMRTIVDKTTGLPMDEDTKNNISNGVGLVAGLLERVGDIGVIKTIPGLNSFLAGSTERVVAQPAMKKALAGIGKLTTQIAESRAAQVAGRAAQTLPGRVGTAIVTNSVEEVSQEVVNIIGEEISATYDKGGVAIADGILRAYDKIENDPKTRARLFEVGVVGGVAGGTFSLGGNIVSSAISSMQAETRSPLADPMPQNSDLVNPQSPQKAAQDVLQFQQIVDVANEATKKTGLYSKSAKMANEMKAKILESSGVKQLFITKENLENLSPDERTDLEAALDPQQLENVNNNAPARITMQQFAPLIDKRPGLMEWFSLQPEGPWPGSARDYAQQFQQRTETRARLLGELGVMQEQTPEQRADSAAMLADADDSTIINTLKSKEAADAYLARLDRNEETIVAAPEGNELAAEAAQKLAEIRAMRERVTALREQLPDDAGAQAIINQAILAPEPTPDVFGEGEFMMQPVIPEDIRNTFPEVFTAEIENAEAMNRAEIVKQINEAAELEMNRIVDITEREANEVTAQQEYEATINDPNIDVVERFLNYNGGDLPGLKKRKGYSLLAIDPRSVDPELYGYYKADDTLKARKVFVRGGAQLEQVAQILGRNPQELLYVLSRTLSRSEAVKVAVDRERSRNRQLAETSVDLNETALSKAYADRTGNIVRMMNMMKDDRWSTMKKAIRKVALDVPKSEVIRERANNAILDTRIGDLNVNQFKVGERKSRAAAVKAITDYDPLTAFQNLERQALNNELTRATQIAIGTTNQITKLAQRFERAETKSMLRDAGPKYEKAANEILETFNLRRVANKNLEEFKAFKSWTEKMIQEGHGNFEFDQPMEIKEQLNDMTVREVVAVGRALKTILHTAEEANMLKLSDKTTEPTNAFAARVREHAQAQPGYDLKKTVAIQGDTASRATKAAASFDSYKSLLQNLDFLMAKFDGRKLGGMMYNEVVGRLQGIGEFTAGAAGKLRDQVAIFDRYEQIVKQYGKAEWRQLRNIEYDIPEFAGNPKLNNGRVSHAELIMMMLNYGNAGNKQRLSNFTWLDNSGNVQGNVVDADVVMRVAQRHLTHKDMNAVQGIFDTYQGFFGRVKEMHQRVSGNDVEMVQAEPFAFTDASGETRVYNGGYYPINYSDSFDVNRLRKSTERLQSSLDGDKIFLEDSYHADDMTAHRHTESRTGSDRALNLNIDTIGTGMSMIIHDLNYREAIRDVMKIMTHPTISEDMMAVLGSDGYNVALSTVVNLGEPIEFRRAGLANSTKVMERWASQPRSQVAVAALVGNLKSVMMQSLSVPYMQARLGPTGPMYTASVIGSFTNPFQWKDLYAKAVEINPMIDSFRVGIDDNQRDVTKKLNPKRDNVFAFGPFGRFTDAKATDFYAGAKDKGFGIFGLVDTMTKTFYTLAAYRQFMDGNAPGHDKASVMQMSLAERDIAAKNYAVAHSRTTGTTADAMSKAPIQLSSPMITMFFNDARNNLNNIMSDIGEIKDASGLKGKAGAVTSFMMVMLLSRLLRDEVERGEDELFNLVRDEKKDIPEREYLNTPLDFGLYTLGSPVVNAAGNVPFLRDITFGLSGADMNRGKVQVNTIETTIMNNIGQAMYAGKNFMEYVKGERDLSERDEKALLNTFGYFIKEVPVNTIYKRVLPAIEKVGSWFDTQKADADTFKQDLKEFKQQQEQLEPAERVDPEALKMLDEIDFAVNPPTEQEAAALVPANTYDVIKQIESGGNQYAKNPNSTAYGLYQFLEKTWDDVREAAPELGLTKNGRLTSVDQQEAAMKWLTEQNAKAFMARGIDVTTESLYAAHFLGLNTALEVYSAQASDKLKAIAGQKVIDANDFANNMRVRDFKRWVARKVQSASRKAEGTEQEVASI